ncbi:MAG: hypothetical protein JW780_01670 [Clostridiales bacterium]|nr:hypothetical protein [Clostridiales bacterium]
MPVIISVYGALVIATCSMHGSEKFRGRYAFFKLLTSLCFVAIALFAGFKSDFQPLFFYLLPGFWFAVAGDYMLGLAHMDRNYKGKRFLLGAAAFMLAHISFYLAYSAANGFLWADFVFPLLFTIFMFFFMRGEKFSLGRMRIPGLMYSFFVALLVSKGVLLMVENGVSVRNFLILCGGVFFLISDMILLFMYFHVPSSKKPLGAANLATYYLAMGLLGMSLYPFG